ncbi:hypothetical protein KVR01_008033 [Diaporthe batatas]|uniref:uncharacterized protein n=1 Tax=Diaporthe batatas TaxID=748121 RepID=UPI001D04DD14|nr:uncharacterized protein KVR01_008033 [Diaporthe batatas]KAG8162268.1 hypothetical protein KVR01_008033 [Diaporthe batatas]
MSQAYPSLLWHETSPGLWQRDVDEAEKFYYSLAKRYEGCGRMFFAITGHLSLSVDIPEGQSQEAVAQRFETALRHGWLALRYEHPTIASRVSHNPATGQVTKSYRTRLTGHDAWLAETFVPIGTGEAGEEWANSDPPAPKVPTLFVVKPREIPTGPATSSIIRADLVLRSPHEIVDGIGTLHMFNNLMRLVADAYDAGSTYEIPRFDGSEIKNLSPPFRVAANVPTELTDRQKQHLAEQNAHKAAASQDDGGIKVLALPYQHGPVAPGRHQRIALDFSERDTAALVAACKRLKATVTQAFHAAIAMAVRDIQDRRAEAQRVRYVNYILRNERRSCVEPYNTPKHAVSVYHSVSGRALTVDMTLPATGETADPADRADEFGSIVEKMRNFYEAVRDDADHYALSLPIWEAGCPELPKNDTLPPVPSPNPKPSVSISSMGNVDAVIASKHGQIEVDKPWVTGEELGNGLGLFLGTFRSRMSLSAAYNDAWHSKSEVEDFVSRCKDIVLAGLGLSEGSD